MSRWSRLIPFFAVAVLLAACGQDSDTPISAPAPLYDDGVVVGGNSTGGSGSGSGSTTNTTTPTDTTTKSGVVVGGN